MIGSAGGQKSGAGSTTREQQFETVDPRQFQVIKYHQAVAKNMLPPLQVRYRNNNKESSDS